MRIFAAQLRRRFLFDRRFPLMLNGSIHEVIGHPLRVPRGSMNLVRVFFQDRDPILDIGRAALWIMPDSDALTRSSWR